MTPRRQLPLVALLSIAFVLVAAVPVAIVTLLTVFQFVPQVKEQIVQRQLSVADALGSQVTRYFGIAVRELTAIKNLLLNSPDYRNLNAGLDAFVTSSDFYEAIYLIDEHGRVAAIGLPETSRSLRANHLDQDFSRREFYRQARAEQRVVWSDSFLSPVSGRMAIAVAQPMGERMLVGEVGINPLPGISQTLAANTGTSLMLVDRSDQLVAHSENLYPNQQFSVSNLSVVRNARAGQPERLLPYELAGETLVGSAIAIPGLDWLAVVAQTEAQAYEPVRSIWLRLFVIVSLALAGAVVVALFTARMLSRPFRRFAAQTQAIASGDYQQEQQSRHRIREFRVIHHQMTRMAQAIEQREAQMSRARDELAELNATLEQRVAQRTDELSGANSELMHTLSTLKHTRGELQRSEKLASLGAMVAGIAHELNTPIGNALMAASAHEADLEKLESLIASGSIRRSEIADFIQRSRAGSTIVQRNIARANELVASFKQVAVDRSSSQRRAFAMRELVHDVVVALNPTLTKSHITVTQLVDESLHLESYPGPLGQVLTNLIDNAVIHAYGSAGGRIHIIASALGTDTVCVSIADQGQGIPPAVLPRIFDPFFTTRLGMGGSGLGLHIVHNLVVDLLGGRIEAISPPGQGARFDVIIPLVAPTSEGADDSDALSSAGLPPL